MPSRRWFSAALIAAAVAAFAPGPVAQARHYVAVTIANETSSRSAGEAYQEAPVDEPPAVRLAAVGDVGTGDGEERDTATAMASVARPPYDALVLLGDNVYPSGDPARLDATVFEPFAAVLDDGTELVATLGNHDVEDGNAQGQIEALGMPGRWYVWRTGPVAVIVLDSTRADDPKQRAWLEATLSVSDAAWNIVALHHPPYSAGWHGSDEKVRSAFEPLFNRYGVQLVLAGHDHDYQRSKPINGTTYVVSGAGAKTRPTGRAAFTEVSWSDQHFLDLRVWPDRLDAQVIAQDGRVYDRFTLRP